MIYATPLLLEDLTIPSGLRGNDACAHIDNLDLDPESFDYKLWTDGSGHEDGYGATAAVWRARDGAMDTAVSGNYGQTVNRNEFAALLDGIQSIVSHRIRTLGETQELPKIPINVLSGADRATIAWYTDRQSLALMLVFDEHLRPIYKRTHERDLWARYAFFARHVCIVPYYRERNTVPEQGLCDTLCGIMRTAMKTADGEMKLESSNTQIEWKIRKQSAIL